MMKKQYGCPEKDNYKKNTKLKIMSNIFNRNLRNKVKLNKA